MRVLNTGKYQLLTAKLLMTLSMLVLYGCGDDVSAPPLSVPSVMISTVATQSIKETSEFIGRTTAVNDVQIRARVQGYLLQRNFREGDDIAINDVLFVIDPEPYEAAAAAARGDVELANAEVVRATDDLKRYERLIKSKSVSEQTLDKARSDKLQADARLTSARAKLKAAENDLQHTVIRAPISGRIGRSIVSVGNLIEPGSGALARLVELDPIYVAFAAGERELISVKERNMQGAEGSVDIGHLEVKLRLPNNRDYSETGRIDFIDNAVDPNTGTVMVRAKFPNNDQLLVPGLFVRAILSREETVDTVMIPEQSLQEDQAGRFVMLVDTNDTVDIRRVKIGRSINGYAVVLDGLQIGERVVVEGIQKIRPGMTVKSVEAPMPAIQGS